MYKDIIIYQPFHSHHKSVVPLPEMETQRTDFSSNCARRVLSACSASVSPFVYLFYRSERALDD